MKQQDSMRSRLNLHRFRLNVPIFRVSIGMFIAVTVCGLAIMFAVDAAHSIISSISVRSEEPSWIPTVLTAINSIVGLILVLFWSLSIWTFGVKMAKIFVPLFIPTSETIEVEADPEDEPKPKQEIRKVEFTPMVRTLEAVNEVITALEADQGIAEDHLGTANVHVLEIIRLARGVAKKAKQMELEVGKLEEAVEAVLLQDTRRLAAARGAIKDTHIKELLKSGLEFRHTYWDAAVETVTEHQTDLSAWVDSYHQLMTEMLGLVSASKTRMLAVEANLERMKVGAPFLTISASLREAESLLAIENASDYQKHNLSITQTKLLRG